MSELITYTSIGGETHSTPRISMGNCTFCQREVIALPPPDMPQPATVPLKTSAEWIGATVTPRATRIGNICLPCLRRIVRIIDEVRSL